MGKLPKKLIDPFLTGSIIVEEDHNGFTVLSMFIALFMDLISRVLNFAIWEKSRKLIPDIYISIK